MSIVKRLFVGGVETFDAPDGKPLRSAVRKRPVEQIRLQISGFPGDASAERDHHTRDKAVHLFSEEGYTDVESCLATTLPRPAFGENLTTTGLRDEDVYVGDVLSVGESLICVTQPTERCRTIGRALGQPRILKILHNLEICGYYARVVSPGHIGIADTITLEERIQGKWSVKRLHQFMFRHLTDDARFEEVMSLTCLSDEWKGRAQVMRGRARRGEPLSSNLVGL